MEIEDPKLIKVESPLVSIITELNKTIELLCNYAIETKIIEYDDNHAIIQSISGISTSVEKLSKFVITRDITRE